MQEGASNARPLRDCSVRLAGGGRFPSPWRSEGKTVNGFVLMIAVLSASERKSSESMTGSRSSEVLPTLTLLGWSPSFRTAPPEPGASVPKQMLSTPHCLMSQRQVVDVVHAGVEEQVLLHVLAPRDAVVGRRDEAVQRAAAVGDADPQVGEPLELVAVGQDAGGQERLDDEPDLVVTRGCGRCAGPGSWCRG